MPENPGRQKHSKEPAVFRQIPLLHRFASKAHSSMSSAQVGPSQPSAQLHKNPSFRSTHDPLLEHGFERQSSISWEQFSPAKPWGHWHSYWATRSTQTLNGGHSAFRQSSMLFSHRRPSKPEIDTLTSTFNDFASLYVMAALTIGAFAIEIVVRIAIILCLLARSSILARVHGTGIIGCVTNVTHESGRAFASEIRHTIRARGTILTGIRDAFVDISLAIRA